MRKKIKNMIAALFTLQLFAQGTEGIVDPATGSVTAYSSVTEGKNMIPSQLADFNGLSVEMKTYYNEKLLRKAGPRLVHEQFGMPAPIPARRGDRAEFRVRKTMGKALTPIVEGVTPKSENMTIYPIYAEVEQYGSYQEYTDKISLVAIDPVISEATAACAEQAALTLDTVVREIINSGYSVAFAAKDGTRATKRVELTEEHLHTVKDVFRNAAKLKANNAPKTADGNYVAIIHPYVAYDIMMAAGDLWRGVMSYAKPENMLKGEIGQLGGVRFCESSEAKIFKGDKFPLGDGSHVESLNASASTSTGGVTTITVSDTLKASDPELVGRWITPAGTGKRYQIASNTANTIVLTGQIETEISAATKIYPGEGGKDNCAVFSTLYMGGGGTYGVVDLGGKGTEIIAKPLGAGNDPLNQRCTIGWKSFKGAEILHDEYMIRNESGSSFSNAADAN